jgi:hypothetical protein
MGLAVLEMEGIELEIWKPVPWFQNWSSPDRQAGSEHSFCDSLNQFGNQSIDA